MFRRTLLALLTVVVGFAGTTAAQVAQTGSIQVVIAETKHHGIDTPEQYDEFVRRWSAENQA